MIDQQLTRTKFLTAAVQAYAVGVTSISTDAVLERSFAQNCAAGEYVATMP